MYLDATPWARPPQPPCLIVTLPWARRLWPICSARYGGPGATDPERVELLLGELGGVEDARRTARFVCALALASPEGILIEVERACEGRITHEPRGSGGFGYDPVFFYEEFGLTFAQVPLEAKNKVSHRGRALRALCERLAELLGKTGT